MNTLFAKRPGEIYDVFLSLWTLNNYEYAKEKIKKFGFELNKNIEEVLNSFITNEKIDIKKLSQYFDRDISVPNVFCLEDIWRNKTLDEYLTFIKNLSDIEIRERIIIALENEEIDKDILEKKACDNQSVLKHIKDMEISSSLKWNIFCLLNDQQVYIEDFIDFIKSYFQIYRKVEKERNKQLDEFNINFQRNIEKCGVEFLKRITKDMFKFEDYDRVYISSSVFSTLTISVDEEENACYIVVGPQVEEYFKKNYGINNLENNLNIFKNLSDKTRFSIIKLLLERDYYGQEIAKALNITTATVSYHMNYLTVSRLVLIERRDHKAYYSLNKNMLRNCIRFLNNEFEL